MNGAGEKRKRAESAYNTRESMVKNREKKIKSFPFVSSKDRGSDESQRLPTASNEDARQRENERTGCNETRLSLHPLNFALCQVGNRQRYSIAYKQANEREIIRNFVTFMALAVKTSRPPFRPDERADAPGFPITRRHVQRSFSGETQAHERHAETPRRWLNGP